MGARTLLRPRWPRPTRGASPAHDNNRKGFDPKAEPSGGEEGIRTPGAREGSTVFKTAAIDHSATSPVAFYFTGIIEAVRVLLLFLLVAVAGCGRSSPDSDFSEGEPMADTGITQLQKADVKVGQGAEASRPQCSPPRYTCAMRPTCPP